jgi:hypothetical protein
MLSCLFQNYTGHGNKKYVCKARGHKGDMSIGKILKILK